LLKPVANVILRLAFLRKRNPAMNVSLTPELEQLVQDKVRSGRYNSASEVVREALRLLEERDRLRELRAEELRRRVAGGSSGDSGAAFLGDEVLEDPALTSKRRDGR
jgi:antitoxin ParD1/3/4